MDFAFFQRDSFPNIIPNFAGYEKCESGHTYTYYDCPYVLVHYCISGCGKVTKDGKCYNVSPGQCFIIRPGETVSYTADHINPWEYAWFSFDLSDDTILVSLPIVADIQSDIFLQIKERLHDGTCDKLFIAGKTYELLSQLLADESRQKIDYPKSVKRYIQLRYADDITVEQIARNLSINRRYMSRIFKERYGKSVIEYLVDYRLEKAADKLLSGLGVAESATQCGYRDVFNFSKMFKKKYGIPPNKYKKPAP